MAALLLTPLISLGQETCTPHQQISNNVENGTFIEPGDQLIANDFIISPNYVSLEMNSVTLNLLTLGGIDSLDLVIYEDAGGGVGSEIASIPGIVPTSQDSVNTGLNSTLVEVVLNFDPIPLTGDATYWLQAVAFPTDAGSHVAWETTTVNQIGYPLMFDSEGSGWQLGNVDGVFTVSGDCNLISGCLQPENLEATNITTEGADISWIEVGSATSWIVEYGQAGFTPGSGTTVNDDDGTPGITIDGLEIVTGYDVYVISDCSGGNLSQSSSISFTTSDFYCTLEVETEVEPITFLEFAGISNNTSANPENSSTNEYFFDLTAMVEQGGTYPITVEGNTAGPYQTSITLFIDFDQDGEFNTDDEKYEIGLVTGSTGEDSIQVTADITIPEDALAGTTRMRLVKMYDPNVLYDTDGCADIGFGQTEDYMIQVDQGTGIDFNRYNFTMGPNPTSDFVQISSSAIIQNVSVYNVLGQKLMNRELNRQSPKLDLSGFENGTYLMEVEINNEKKIFKVVKQ